MAEKAEYPFDGYTLYIIAHKGEGGRKMANLVKSAKDRTTMSYARYLMSVHLGRFLTKDEQVDHINGDKTDDRIDNFQILTPTENREKYIVDADIKAEWIELVCPVCATIFKNRSNTVKFRLKHGKTPCCSRRCGGIFSHK